MPVGRKLPAMPPAERARRLSRRVRAIRLPAVGGQGEAARRAISEDGDVTARAVDLTDEVLRDRTLMPPASVLSAMSSEDRELVLSHGERRRMKQLELFDAEVA